VKEGPTTVVISLTTSPIAITLAPAGARRRGPFEVTDTVGRAKRARKPGIGSAGRETTLTATRRRQSTRKRATVHVEGPRARGMVVSVTAPRAESGSSRVKVGDLVEATYTEAVAGLGGEARARKYRGAAASNRIVRPPAHRTVVLEAAAQRYWERHADQSKSPPMRVTTPLLA
jgi:hypothetical protein